MLENKETYLKSFIDLEDDHNNVYFPFKKQQQEEGLDKHNFPTNIRHY